MANDFVFAAKETSIGRFSVEDAGFGFGCGGFSVGCRAVFFGRRYRALFFGRRASVTACRGSFPGRFFFWLTGVSLLSSRVALQLPGVTRHSERDKKRIERRMWDYFGHFTILKRPLLGLLGLLIRIDYVEGNGLTCVMGREMRCVCVSLVLWSLLGH